MMILDIADFVEYVVKYSVIGERRATKIAKDAEVYCASHTCSLDTFASRVVQLANCGAEHNEIVKYIKDHRNYEEREGKCEL